MSEPTTPNEREMLIAALNKAAEEIAAAGHFGWGNVCLDAAALLAQRTDPAVASTAAVPEGAEAWQEVVRLEGIASKYASKTEYGEVIFPQQNWLMFVADAATLKGGASSAGQIEEWRDKAADYDRLAGIARNRRHVLEEIAGSKPLTATPQQFANHLQRLAKKACDDYTFAGDAHPTRESGDAERWRDVHIDGLPPCDGETVYVGENDAGYMGCFNAYSDEACWMDTAEYTYNVMSGLRFWRVQDRPIRSAAYQGKEGGGRE